ncbi:MAG: phenylalanine--tRNA ligase subunit alpha [Cytophagales bacterium]|nr:phenylalanine--tRNA ligase subunit alpha [Cytophagales bacterium]
MISKVQELYTEVESFEIKDKETLETFRLNYFAKKGKVNDLFAEFRNVPAEEKKQFGVELNKLKTFVEEKFREGNALVENLEDATDDIGFDLTLPSIPEELGTRHPLSVVRERMVEIFNRIGFDLSEGPEIEDDFHNFTALNFPPDHPAREMQDTFFIEKDPDIALRTHTSSVQVRVMENQEPPIRTLSPGRVFRNEAISARAHCVFHQLEGLYIDKNVSFADLKDTLYYFVKEMFGEDIKLRFRPSYFPFTEPSAEIDITCLLCKGKGCNVCKGAGWVEIGGAGMVDPNVLKNAGIDPNVYSGFAFGMGLERITMLKYQIKDLRLFTENDVRFLRQFKTLG